jgi:hypothetical protein
VAAACKGKPKHDEVPKNVEHGSAGSATPQAAPNLELPTADPSPPAKSTKPVDKVALDKLGERQFPGFHSHAGNNGEVLTVKHETESRPRIMATVILKACKDDCPPMEVAKWQSEVDKVKQGLAQSLRDAKDTTVEIGATDLKGLPAIYVYQLGQAFGSNGGAYIDQYILYYNDGVNQIRVKAAYTDDPRPTKDDMAKDVPKEDLEKVAKAFADVYAHAMASS